MRTYRIELIDKSYLADVPSISREDGSDKTLLAEGFKSTGQVFEEIIATALQNDGTVKSFKRGIIPMTGYFISHESHHRGHILLTLKQCKLNPDSRFKMSLWEWNTI